MSTTPYETQLSPQDEQAFQSWKQRYAPRDSGMDYDLRGAFKAGLTPAANGHWPDTFKKPNHPTFSDQSIYAKERPDLAGHWNRDTYMAATPIDYDALAAQHGGSAVVDYDALAKEHGAVSVSAPAQQTATISARPQGVGTWLEDLKGDIEQGSGNTLPGRILQKMGAPGINKGVSEGAAQQIAGPLIGPVNTALAARDIPSHPISGTLRTLGGIIQTAGPVTAFVAPEAGEAAGNAVSKLGEMIPSAERAGKNFQEVMGATKNVPIDVTGPGNAALRMDKLGRSGFQKPKVITDFINRVSNPELPELTYEEARNFYSAASSRLSPAEAMRIKPQMRFELTRFTRALGNAIEEATAKTDKLGQYLEAMQEYRNAMRMNQLGDMAKDAGVNLLKQTGKGAAGALGAYEVYKAVKDRK